MTKQQLLSNAKGHSDLLQPKRGVSFVVEAVLPNGDIQTSHEFYTYPEATAGVKALIITQPGVTLTDQQKEDVTNQVYSLLEQREKPE